MRKKRKNTFHLTVVDSLLVASFGAGRGRSNHCRFHPHLLRPLFVVDLVEQHSEQKVGLDLPCRAEALRATFSLCLPLSFQIFGWRECWDSLVGGLTFFESPLCCFKIWFQIKEPFLLGDSFEKEKRKKRKGK